MRTKTVTYNKNILDQLSRYLETFPEEEERLTSLKNQLQEEEAICDRKNMKGHLTGSSLLYNRTKDRVLLVHHQSLDLWIQPGGHLEDQEEPLEGALREFVEETGIESAQLSSWHQKAKIALDIDTHFIPANSKKQESEHFHHDFLYLLLAPESATEEDSLKLNRSELFAHEWVEIDRLIGGHYEEKLKRAVRKIRRLAI